jgi:carboxypeptidase X2
VSPLCAADKKKFCGGVKSGGGRTHECIEAHKEELSEACRKDQFKTLEEINLKSRKVKSEKTKIREEGPKGDGRGGSGDGDSDDEEEARGRTQFMTFSVGAAVGGQLFGIGDNSVIHQGACEMSAYLPICSSAHLPICPSAHLPICPSAHLPICPSAHLPICPSAHLPICPSAHLHICASAHLLICSSAHLPICSSAHLPICPSAHLPICPSARCHSMSAPQSIPPLRTICFCTNFETKHLSWSSTVWGEICC